MTSHTEPDRPLRAYLDDLAELYDDFIGVMDQDGSPPRTWLQSHLPGGRRAIDIGCGNGRNCRMIADRYDEVVGVDISSRVIELAKNKDNPPNVRYETAAIQDTSPEDLGLFDAVFSTNAVFSMGRISAVLPCFRSLIAPGGRLVVIDPTRPNYRGDDPQETRDSAYPFEVAHTIYDMSGDVEGAIAAIRFMTHPSWQEMNRNHLPLTLDQFERAYEAVFPGVRITPNIVPTLTGAFWQAP
jgi:SAM-dependent methyltransferase